MNYSIRSSEISYLKAKLEACQVICRSLEREFVEDSLTAEKRIKVFRHWDATLIEIDEISLELKSLKNRELEECMATLSERQIG